MSERSNNVVPIGSSLHRGTAKLGRKRREEEQAASVQRFLVFIRQFHSIQASSRADDNRLMTSHQYTQAFPLHRGVEPAYDR